MMNGNGDLSTFSYAVTEHGRRLAPVLRRKPSRAPSRDEEELWLLALDPLRHERREEECLDHRPLSHSPCILEASGYEMPKAILDRDIPILDLRLLPRVKASLGHSGMDSLLPSTTLDFRVQMLESVTKTRAMERPEICERLNTVCLDRDVPSAYKKSLRKLRPPGLDRLLLPPRDAEDPSSSRMDSPRIHLSRSSSTSLATSDSSSAVSLSSEVFRGWETFPRRRISAKKAPEVIRRKLDYGTADVSNPSLRLQEAITDSLRITSAESSSEQESPSPESDSYFSPTIAAYFDVASKRIPSNIKELQTQLKSLQDECFTLKMSLHFMEEDYKKHLSSEDLTKENVQLKVENANLKRIVVKKNELLQNSLLLLQKGEVSLWAEREAEWDIQRKDLEQRIQDIEQFWSQRVSELESKLGVDPLTGSGSVCSDELLSLGSVPPSLVSSNCSVTNFHTLKGQDEHQQLPLQEALGLSPPDQYDENKGSIAELKEELAVKTQDLKNMNAEYKQSLKLKDQELNSLHRAVHEKTQLCQKLLTEHTNMVDESHQRQAELMGLCETKDNEISELKLLLQNIKMSKTESDASNNDNNNNANEHHVRFDNELLSSVNQLRSQLETTIQEKQRVMEEAEIMDLQQQEQSEKIESLEDELRALKAKRTELTARLIESERRIKQSESSENRFAENQTISKDLQAALARVNALTTEVEFLKMSRSGQDSDLEQVQLQNSSQNSRSRETCNDEPLSNPSIQQLPAMPNEKNGIPLFYQGVDKMDKPPVQVNASHRESLENPFGRISLSNINSLFDGEDTLNELNKSGNKSCHQKLDLSGLTSSQLCERLAESESLRWALQNHLEELAEFFSALLDHGDLQRFQDSLTPREVRKLRTLVDRTMHISFSASASALNNQSITEHHADVQEGDSMLPVHKLSTIDLEDSLQDSRDRDMSDMSVYSHSRDLADFPSSSESESVHVSSAGDHSARNRRSRGASTHQDQLLPQALFQSLLYALQRSEQTSQKLCLDLENFGQSHFFKLLVEDLLDRLKDSNIKQISEPGREWEEVQQELVCFRRRAQELVLASELTRSCLQETLEHLSKLAQSDNSLVVYQTEKSRSDTLDPGVNQFTLQEMTQSNQQLFKLLMGLIADITSSSVPVEQKGSPAGGDDGKTSIRLNLDKHHKELTNIFGNLLYNEPPNNVTDKSSFKLISKSTSTLCQVIICARSLLMENLKEISFEFCTMKENLQSLERDQESNAKEMRQVQDWNLRLQAEQKNKEEVLQLLKRKEGDLMKKIKAQEAVINQISVTTRVGSLSAEKLVEHNITESMFSELDRKSARKNRNSPVLDNALSFESDSNSIAKSEYKPVEVKLGTASGKLIDYKEKVSTLEAELKSMLKFESQFNSATEKIREFEAREKSLQELVQQTIQAKEDMQISIAALKVEVEKQTAAKFEEENKKATLQMKSALEDLQRSEQQCTKFKKELVKWRSKCDNMKQEWTEKVIQERQERILAETELSTVNRKAQQLHDEKCNANKKIEQLHEELQQTRQKCTVYIEESQNTHLEYEQNRAKIAALKIDLKQSLDDFDKTVEELNRCRQELHKEKAALDSSEKEQNILRGELKEVILKWEDTQKELASIKNKQVAISSQQNEHWLEKLATIEQDTKRLRLELENTQRVNTELWQMLAVYEQQFAGNQNHQTSTAANMLPSSLDGLDCFPPNGKNCDLIGEMRQLKKEVVRNNHSSARLCKELQQHGNQQYPQRQRSEKYSHSRPPLLSPLELPLPGDTMRRSNSRSSSVSERAGMKRMQVVQGIKEDFSSGTGSAETLTLFTASSEGSCSSNAATSWEDLANVSQDCCTLFSIPSGTQRKRGASGDRRKKLPLLESSSSECSLLHARVVRQLGTGGTPTSDGDLDLAPTNGWQGPGSPLFVYEGPVVQMVCQQANPDKMNQRRHSNFSSPDLGIESDPNHSSSSSSTSSSSLLPHTLLHKKLEVSIMTYAAGAANQSLNLEHKDSSRGTEHPQQVAPLSVCTSITEGGTVNDGGMLGGLCHLRNLELLRQELEEALVTLQGTKATVQSSLSSAKFASPAKSLEYNTLREVDSRCQQLGEYLQRCKRLLHTFWVLPLNSHPDTSGSLENQPTLLDVAELPKEDANKLCAGAVKDSGHHGAMVTQLHNLVLNLQNELKDLNEKHRKALEQLKIFDCRESEVNKALTKELRKTKKILKKAKGNLEQDEPTEKTKGEKNKIISSTSAIN